MSKNTLVLDNPILINGETVKELTYDHTEITVGLFTAASAKASAAEKSKTLTMNVKETDYTLHLYLGMAAIIAINPEIDFNDLERIKGYDVLDLTNIGSLFIFRKSAEPSEQSNVVSSSDDTASSSTQAPETSA